MTLIEGKYNSAAIYTNELDPLAEEQIKALCNLPFSVLKSNNNMKQASAKKLMLAVLTVSYSIASSKDSTDY